MSDALRYSVMNSKRATVNDATATAAQSPPRETRNNNKAATNGYGNYNFNGNGNGSSGPAPPRTPPPLRERTHSAPARFDASPAARNKRHHHLLVEEHYRVDPHDKKLLPGLPNASEDENWARDIHDFFNLVSLVPVVVLNVINWNWDVLLDPHSAKTMREAWTGEWFPLFFAVTVGYFVADLLWVAAVPTCVKSPGVIIQHHVATLLYLVVPYRFPDTAWIMGACLSVEVNTWLLIARRVFNKQGFGPWVWDFGFFSVRIKMISILFYATWVWIRCFVYPFILKLLWTLWRAQSEETGKIFHNRFAFCLVLHSVFCVLNFKWTFDLFRGKWRALRSGKAAKVDKGL